MEHIKYIEVKESTQETFDEFINESGFSVKQAVPATLEELVVPMRKYDVYYVAGFLNLAIISMKNGFLPDYIKSRIDEIRTIKLDLLDDDLIFYQNDLKEFNSLFEAQKFEIRENHEYMDRIDLILKD